MGGPALTTLGTRGWRERKAPFAASAIVNLNTCALTLTIGTALGSVSIIVPTVCGTLRVST